MDPAAQAFLDRISGMEERLKALERLESQRKLSRGVVAYTAGGTSMKTVSDAVNFIALMDSITITLSTTRFFRFTFIARAITPGSAIFTSLGIGIGNAPTIPGTSVIFGDHYFGTGGNYDSVNFVQVTPGHGTQKSYVPAGIRRNTTNIDVYPTEFFIEDIGPWPL
jgi:hypothetical protein